MTKETGLPLDEVREIRDQIEERVRELAEERIDAIRSDATAPSETSLRARGHDRRQPLIEL